MTKGNHNHRLGAFYSYDKKDEDCCGASETVAQFWGPNAVPGGAGKGGGWGPAEAPGNGNNVTGNGLADRKSTRSELQSRGHVVCRLLLEKKNRNDIF